MLFGVPLLFLMVVDASGAPDAGQRWRDLVDEGTTLLNAGRYREAETRYRVALALAEDSKMAPAHVASSLHLLGQTCQLAGRLDEALGYMEKSVHMVREGLRPDPLVLAQFQNNYGTLLHACGRYAQAEHAFGQALSVRKRQLGAEHPDTLTTSANLAALYFDEGRSDQAGRLMESVLAVRERVDAPTSLPLACVLQNLGCAYLVRGRFGESERLLERALDMQKRARGASHPEVAIVLSNLGYVHHAQGKNREAELYLLDAIGIYRAAVGDRHPDLGAMIQVLAAVFLAQERLVEADIHATQAIAIFEESLGPDHPKLASALITHASVLRKAGRKRDAKALEARAKRISTVARRENPGKFIVDIGDLVAQRTARE